MFKSITMTAVAALLAGPAFAEGVSFARLSYDYSSYDSDDFDQVDAGLLHGEVEYEISQFLLTAEILNFSIDGDNVSTTYGASGAYVFSPEALAGLGLFATDPDEGDTITGFEAFGQYETAQFGAAINLSQGDLDEDNLTTVLIGEASVIPAVTLGASATTQSEFDGTDYKLVAEYEDGPIFARATIDTFSEDDGGLFGVRGTYDIAPQIRASAAFQTLYGDDFIDLSVIAIGGGYQFVDDLWFDASFGVIQSDSFDDDISVIQASLTYETGARKRLDARFSQAALDDVQAGFGFAF